MRAGSLPAPVAATRPAPPESLAATKRTRFSYRVPPDVGRLVEDDAAFAVLARALRADLTDKYDPQQLFLLAILDALDGDWRVAVVRLDLAASLERGPRPKIMTGLTIRAWTEALSKGGDSTAAFRAALERRLTAAVADRARDELGVWRSMGQLFTPAVCREVVQSHVGPVAQSGAIPLEAASVVVFQRYVARHVVPVGKVIDEVLAARGIQALSP